MSSRDAGAQITLASPKGGRPPLDPKSNEPSFQTDITRRFEKDADANAQLDRTERLDSGHKVAGVREVIESAGATQRFLPAYSPDLDPIEQVFAKLKNMLRKMANRTVDTLWEGIGIALDDFPPNQCLNYFRNAGYGST